MRDRRTSPTETGQLSDQPADRAFRTAPPASPRVLGVIASVPSSVAPAALFFSIGPPPPLHRPPLLCSSDSRAAFVTPPHRDAVLLPPHPQCRHMPRSIRPECRAVAGGLGCWRGCWCDAANDSAQECHACVQLSRHQRKDICGTGQWKRREIEKRTHSEGDRLRAEGESCRREFGSCAQSNAGGRTAAACSHIAVCVCATSHASILALCRCVCLRS